MVCVLFVGILLIILFCLFFMRRTDIKTVYHVSEWNSYSPEIERALRQQLMQTKPTEITLQQVYGSVVSHHIPTTIPKLVDIYSSLATKQSVKKFIIIGPDHTNSGKTPITVSDASFFTIYGEVKPIEGLASTLEAAKLATIQEAPFDKEHSIGSQILVISKIFPNANVTPIILRSNVTKEEAEALGRKLATFLDEDTVLIASVDFSHYLPTTQATPIDVISGNVIRNLDSDAISLVKADSSKSMLVFIRAMSEKKATDTSNFEIVNTNDLMQNSDYTTGYVFGFWGIN